MEGIKDKFRQFLLPRRCLCCQGSLDLNEWICTHCRHKLPQIHAACPVCGIPNALDTICGRCLSHPPRYQHTCAPFRFENPINTLVYRFKYQDRFFLARVLGQEIFRHLARSGLPMPGRILPLPLHPKRLHQRGFNQSLLLAQVLARELGIPCHRGILIRHRYARPQVELSARQRKAAVDGAFRVKHPLPARHIAVIDDVISTGHTANQAARALRQAGAETVSIWAVARNT